MSSAALEQLKLTVSNLPAEEREELAEYLWSTLDSAEDIKAEWIALAESRMVDVRAGRVVGIPAEEVLKHLLDPEQ